MKDHNKSKDPELFLFLKSRKEGWMGLSLLVYKVLFSLSRFKSHVTLHLTVSLLVDYCFGPR